MNIYWRSIIYEWIMIIPNLTRFNFFWAVEADGEAPVTEKKKEIKVGGTADNSKLSAEQYLASILPPENAKSSPEKK